MSIQTSYPIFESGQVLTSSHLNDLVEYLEQQDRLTRNKLIGIGVVCGLEPSYQPQQNRVRITRGCAVTSEGYLICLEESLLNKVRKYTLPQPELEEADEDLVEDSKYPFFFDANGVQIDLWELFPNDFVPNPGEPPVQPINASFLADKVVMLFLECDLQSLKNCDVNDCSDKGAELEFNVRKLLISKSDATAILQQEEKIAERPVDRRNHPRYDLKEIQIEKINPSAHGIDNFTELLFRILKIAFQVVPDLGDGLKKAYSAYKYLLGDLYPASQFPNGPFGTPGYFGNVLVNLLQNLFLAQYFYDYLYDVVQSHNEFLREACRLDAECSPATGRFPKHVLLGEPKQQPVAFSKSFGSVAEILAFDPAQASTGVGPTTRPAAFRHHFIPSPILNGQHSGLERVRSLHYRTYLLAYRYSTKGKLLEPIRLTPSKDGDYQLSAKSIPFYYAFKPGDDLHRSWSYSRTVKNRLDRVFSHGSIDPTDHPLRHKLDDHNFYRVEGIVGKSLGQAMTELLDQKRKLGLSFGIEPVFIGLSQKDDPTGLLLNKEAAERARVALVKLLLCRMRDLDVVFLILIATLFFYLFAMIRLLARVNTLELAAGIGESPPSPEATVLSGLRARKRFRVDRTESDQALRAIRKGPYKKGDLAGRLTTVDDPKKSIGRLYSEIKEAPSSSNLFDRTLEFARGLDPDLDAQQAARRIYPAISLIDQSEGLVETLSAPSLAEFDFDRFQTRFSGFVQTFDDYMVQAVAAPADSGVAVVNQQLQSHYDAIATTGPQTLLAGLADELRKRLGNVFGELLLGSYAKRHPGMEHKAGVPRGGTLILLYTHKAFLAQALERASSEIQAKVQEGLSKLADLSLAGSVGDLKKILTGLVPSSNDQLRDFVVLGDFCVPYLCCDSDCSDIDLAPVDRTEPEPVVVEGTIFGRRGGAGGVARVVPNAEVRVVHLDQNLPVSVQLSQGVFAFTGPPGSYKIETEAQRFLPASRVVTLSAGSRRTEDFLLVAEG